VLGPSIVTLALTFVLGDAEARRLDTVLRDDVESRVDKIGATRYAPKNVYQVKSGLVRSIISELGGRCLVWLKEKFPGSLAAAGGLGVPVFSLISLFSGKPFETQADYLRLLDLTNATFASRFERPDYLYMTPRMGRARNDEFIAAFNEADALAPESYPSLSVVPEIIHDAISPFMIMDAVQGVLGTFESRMRDIRADLEKLDFESATDSQVVGLRNKLLGLSRDSAIVCGDLIAVVGSFMFWADYPLMALVDPNQASLQGPGSTIEVVRRDLRSLVQSVQSQESGLRELVLVTSQAVTDAQNMKLQRDLLSLNKGLGRLTFWLLILTAAVVLGTGVLVYLAFHPSSDTSTPVPVPSRSISATARSSTPAARASTAAPKASKASARSSGT
jgi:hypothetical protein